MQFVSSVLPQHAKLAIGMTQPTARDACAPPHTLLQFMGQLQGAMGGGNTTAPAAGQQEGGVRVSVVLPLISHIRQCSIRSTLLQSTTGRVPQSLRVQVARGRLLLCEVVAQ